jgi:hypothetical protein
MSALAFLLVALAISVLGSMVLWLTHRQRPPSIESGIEEFERELKALAPEANPRTRTDRRPPDSWRGTPGEA